MAVLDDNLFVRTANNQVRPLTATFHRFVETVARTGRFEPVRYLAPVRRLQVGEAEPSLAPIDEAALELIPTTYFSGIGDYLLRSAYLSARNWRPINRAIADSDLVWLRLPASNALLALTAARRHHVAHFGWVAGSAREVAQAQQRPIPVRWAAQAVGGAYDAATRLCGRSGPLIHLDADIFASIVSAAEVERTRAAFSGVREQEPWRIVWAGRMAAEKGLPEIVEAVRLLLERDHEVKLVLIGDGPARTELESAARRLPDGRVEWRGYVGDRATYLDLLRGSDLLIYPSRADAVPKVLVDALACGLPVVAADVGAVGALLGHGERGLLVPIGDTSAMAQAMGALLGDPAVRTVMHARALAWAAEHTAEAQAERLIGRLQVEFPHLPWPA